MGEQVSFGLAFFAGLLSFLSPCVLPLIPAYISYLTGRAAQQAGGEVMMSAGGNAALTQKLRLGVVLHGIFFVLGFTLVFVVFGITINSGALALRRASIDAQNILREVGGLIVIFFGLHLLGATAWVLRNSLSRLPWDRLGAVGSGLRRVLESIQSVLYGDTRRQMNPRSPYGYLGSSMMGVVFGAGWSPCIGPILGSILVVASSGGSLGQAGGLLTAYSLGLGVPFLLAAVALDSMRGLMKRLQRQMRMVEVVSGVFLVILGFMLYTGTLTQISQAGGSLALFSYNLEACGTGVVQGKYPLSDLGECLQVGPNYRELKELEQRKADGTAGNSGGGGNSQVTPSAPEGVNASVGTSDVTGAAGASNAVLPAITPIPAEVAAKAEVGLEVGQVAPDFTLRTLDGREVSLVSLRGRVVLLNFWATWCVPCAKEMPDFEKLTQTLSADKFVVLAVNNAETPDVVRPFVDKLGLTFPIALDSNGKVNRSYKAFGLPLSLVLDPNGIILEKRVGPFDPEQLPARAARWLASIPG
jgi:cytochrome c-type biogenesis protein